MGNKQSTSKIQSHGLISLVRPNFDIKESLKTTGLHALNAQQSHVASHNRYALEVDSNTLAFVMIARASGAAKAEKVVETAKECKTFMDKSKVQIFHADNLPMLPFLQQDEDSPAPHVAQSAFKLLAHDLSTLAMVEKYPVFFDRVEDADRSKIQIFGSDALPAQTVYWHHWKSDNTIQNFAFNGLGAYYLSRVTEKAHPTVPDSALYEINLEKYKDFDMRRLKDAEEEPHGVLRRGLEHIAQHFKKKEDSPPETGNDEMFHRYGGIFYFDEAKKPLGIYWPEKQAFIPLHSHDFQVAWHVFRSTMVTVATVQHHLIMVHWIVANSATVNCARYLSASHPIRRLLKPHTYGTAAVNFNSTAILAPIRGLAYRIFGFNQKGFLDMVVHSLQSFKYESIQEHFEAAHLNPEDAKHIPFYEDGFGLWDVIEDYVRNYINLTYPQDSDITNDTELQTFWTSGYQQYFGPDAGDNYKFEVGELSRTNMIKLFTYHIFWVSGGHEFIGSIVEYLVDVEGLSPKVYKPRPEDKKFVHKYETDVQSFFQALSLISLTSGNMPKLIDNWAYLYDDDSFLPKGEKREAILRNLATYQERLVEHSKTVRKRNLKRIQPLNVFSEHLESSVSV